MSKIIIARLIPYTGTDAALTTLNPIPAQSEIVIVKPASGTLYKMKIGDGLTPYTGLPFFTGAVGTPQNLQDTLNLGYTADLPGENRINLNNTVGNTRLVLDPQGGIAGFYGISPLRQTIGFHSTTTPYFFIRDTLLTAFVGKIFAQPQTAAHVWGLPDKDGTFAMMSDVTAAGALQGVLNAGNSATEAGADIATIILNKTSNNTSSLLYPGALSVIDTAAGYSLSIHANSGSPVIELVKSARTGTLKMISTMSANRGWLLPDEGSGSTVDDAFVIHKTKNTITVQGTGSAISLKMVETGFFQALEDVSINEKREHNIVNYGNIWQFIDSSGSPYTYNHKLLPYLGADTGAPAAGGVTIENWLPQHNGELMTNDGGSASQALVAAATMVVTHGAPFTPRMASVEARNAAAAAALPGYYISAIGATTFTITFAAPVTGTINIDYTVF